MYEEWNISNSTVLDCVLENEKERKCLLPRHLMVKLNRNCEGSYLETQAQLNTACGVIVLIEIHMVCTLRK